MESFSLKEYKLLNYQDTYKNNSVSGAPSNNCVFSPYLPETEKDDSKDKTKAYKIQSYFEQYNNNVTKVPSDNSVFSPYLPKPEKDENTDVVMLRHQPVSKAATVYDNSVQFMNEMSPGFAFDMIPDNYLKFASNSTMLDNSDEAELLRVLPRKADGSYDTEKIRKYLELAVNTVKSENAGLDERLNFGTYKNNINGVVLWAFLMGPEISGCLENAGLLKAQRMFSLQDLNLGNIIQSCCSDPEACELLEKVCFKSSFEIKDNIAKQNRELDELLDIDLSTEEGIKTLLKKYKEVTKTGFCCQNMENYLKAKNDDEVNKEQKMEKYMAAFGTVDNAVDTTNCEIFTMVMYEVIFKMLIPKIIKNCVPYGKYFGPIIPAGVETAETLTSGTKPGQVINTDKINVENAARVAVDGFAHYLMVSDLDFGFLSKIYHDCPGADKMPNWFLRWNYKNAFRGARSGVRYGVTMLTASAWDPVFGRTLFDNNANKWERTVAAIFHCMTGYVFIPSAIEHRNDCKKDEKNDKS
jgi:hypothetical protein